MDEGQKAKLIFISLAAVVTILLIFSFVSGNRAKTARDAALKEVEAMKADNAKLSQWLEERTQELERYKKSYETCQTKLKYSAPAKKTSAKKPAAKTTKKKKSR
jgi:cell division protein FtsB